MTTANLSQESRKGKFLSKIEKFCKISAIPIAFNYYFTFHPGTMILSPILKYSALHTHTFLSICIPQKKYNSVRKSFNIELPKYCQVLMRLFSF